MEDFKISIKAARVNAGLTQKKASELLGIDPTTLVNWEKNPNKVKMDKAIKLSEIYNIPINYLFFGK